MNYKYIGTISGVRAYNGEMILSDCPEWKIKIAKEVSIKIGFSEKFAKVFTLKSLNSSKGYGSIIINEIKSDAEALKMKEQGVFVDENALENDNKKVFAGEFNNYKVFNNETGKLIGKVIEYWEMPANDCILVQTEQGELPIPFIPEFILEINKRQKKIYVNVMDGLMDLLNQDKDEDADD